MKKLIMSIAILGLSLSSFAQGNFDKFETNRDITSMVINQKMFKLLGKMDLDSKDPEMKGYIDMVNSLQDIKVFSTNSTEASKLMQAQFNSYLTSAKLEQLMQVKDDGKNVRFYFKPGKSEDFVNEFVMFLDGTQGKDETVIIKITGDIDLKQIGKFANSINFSGSEQLKNVKVK